MAKPKTKLELLEQSKINYEKLFELINALPKEKLENDFAKGTLNRNVRDVLIHLHSWHVMFLTWYKIGMKGQKPHMPAEGFTWQTLPKLNQKIWKETQDVELKKARKLLSNSYKKCIAVIESHSEDELYTKKLFDWTGSTSLAAYLISNTCSHYNWAYKVIKKGVK